MYKLLDGATGTTTGDAVQLVDAGVDRDWAVHVSGDLSSGNVTIEASPDGSNDWAPLLLSDGSAELTTEGVWQSGLSRMWFVRAKSSGVTSVTVGVQ